MWSSLREMWPADRLARGLAVVVSIFLLAWMIGCASMPAKQRAVVSLQTVDKSLSTAQDLVEANHTLFGLDTPASATEIKACDTRVLAPQTLPPVPSKFNIMGCLFVMAFDAEAVAGLQLKSWQAGQPLTFMATLKTEIDLLFGFARGVVTSPKTAQLIAAMQAAVDETLNIITMLQGATA